MSQRKIVIIMGTEPMCCIFEWEKNNECARLNITVIANNWKLWSSMKTPFSNKIEF